VGDLDADVAGGIDELSANEGPRYAGIEARIGSSRRRRNFASIVDAEEATQ
jgi:hypothetical protein